jgi:hypothetical protein
MIEVVYMMEKPPIKFFASVFLAGSPSRLDQKPSWRSLIIRTLYKLGYSGVVFHPEWRTRSSVSDKKIREWRSTCIRMSDIIVFYLDSDTDRFDLDLELGEGVKLGKVVFSWASEYDKISDFVTYVNYPGIKKVEPSKSRADTLTALAEAVANQTRNGAYRSYGERFVPLYIWHHPSFQSWYNSHRRVGNYLTDANLEYVFRIFPNSPVFLFVLHAHLWIVRCICSD